MTDLVESLLIMRAGVLANAIPTMKLIRSQETGLYIAKAFSLRCLLCNISSISTSLTGDDNILYIAEKMI